VQSSSWEKAHQMRVDLLIRANPTWRLDNPNRDADVGKWTWSPLLAEMWKVRNDKAAVSALIHGKGAEFMKSRWAGSYYKAFSAPGPCMYYFTFKDQLPGDQKKHAQNMIQSRGWSQMMRKDGRMDPIYTATEFNSENFNWMARMAGVLWAEELKDKKKQEYFDTHLENLTRALFNAGRVEWNSNNYWGHTFNPIMSLATHIKAKGWTRVSGNEQRLLKPIATSVNGVGREADSLAVGGRRAHVASEGHLMREWGREMRPRPRWRKGEAIPGHIEAFSVPAGEPLAHIQIDSAVINNGLAVAGGRLYATCEDGTVRCYK
jgi:hypothetical protein